MTVRPGVFPSEDPNNVGGLLNVTTKGLGVSSRGRNGV